MAEETVDVEIEKVAAALLVSIGLLRRRVRQTRTADELSLPETAALARVGRGGPTTVTELAKLEQISTQSMGATLNTLEARGLIERRADPDDGRRSFISATDAGMQVLVDRRAAKTQHLARAMASGFSPSELTQLMAAAPLIERLALSL